MIGRGLRYGAIRGKTSHLAHHHHRLTQDLARSSTTWAQLILPRNCTQSNLALRFCAYL